MALTFTCVLAHLAAHAAQPIRAGQPVKVPMTANRWRLLEGKAADPKPDVQFIRKEGFPEGILILKAGEMALNDFNFRDGTIEFDIKPLAADIPGIRFRQGTQGSAEEFYLRSFGDCRASNDCIQYTPVIHGFMLWNAYPEYQTQAPVVDGWNHVKLVVSGRRMNVFINQSPAPNLAVGELEADSFEGGIQLRGPAAFANLVISPNAVGGLPAQATPDPSAGDARIVRHWFFSPLTPLHYGKDPSYAEMPARTAGWKKVAAERDGFVNLNREFHATDDPPALIWLSSSVVSEQDAIRRVSLGWIGQAWIFVNGKLITQGKNFYYPESERRDPDGRLSFENGSFNLPLRKGNNEIAIALYSATHDDNRSRTAYAWGLKMRFDDLRGIRQTK